MDLHQRTLRVGLMAILCAAAFRLCSMDFSARLTQFFSDPNIAAFLIYLETGRSVRFSPSLETFSPHFVETPPPTAFLPPERVIPSFSDTSLVELTYSSSVKPEIETLLTVPLHWDLYSQEPTVLILHTHTTESYAKGSHTYAESAAFRTLEGDYNMLAIGARTTQILQSHGIYAIQDREIHDYPSYNGSYSHARKSISAYLEEYPSIQLILDLHRDASESNYNQLRTLTHIEGERSAQLMVVIGTNHSNYEDNLSLGLKLHAQLETQAPGLTRPLQLRNQRFNQDLSPGALLVEVGAAGNSHEEALIAASQLAEAVIALAKGTA